MLALRKNDRIDLLRAVPLFSRCSKRELAELAGLTTEIARPSGSELICEGRVGHEFFVLVEGAADVHRNGRTVARLGPGDYTGETALLSQLPRTATVRTTAPSRVLVLAERDFRTFVQRSPSVAFKLLEELSERVPEAQREYAQSARRDVRVSSRR